MATKIQFRRGTTAQWTAANTVLAEAEIGYDITLKKFKIGDGTTAWNSLSFFESGSGGGVSEIPNDSDWIGRHFVDDSDVTKSTYTIFVDPAGSDSNPGNVVFSPKKTLAAADLALGQGDACFIFNGRYQENLTIATRNSAWMGFGGAGASGAFVQIDSITAAVSGVKVQNLNVVGNATFTNTDAGGSNIGNHYNEVLFGGTTTVFNGAWFHEAHHCKFQGVQFGGAGGKYFYNCEIEGALTISHTAGAVTLMSHCTSGSVNVQGAGTVFVADNMTAGAPGTTITIGAGVIYQMNDCKNYAYIITPGAIRLKDYYISQGLSEAAAEAAASSRFDSIVLPDLEQQSGVSFNVLVKDTATGAVRWVDKNASIDSDWLKERILEGANTGNAILVDGGNATGNSIIEFDSEFFLQQIYTNRVDSDWVLSQVGTGGGGTGTVDSEWTLRHIYENRVDSEWVQSIASGAAIMVDGGTSATTGYVSFSNVDSDWVLSQIVTGGTVGGGTGTVDSDWALRQIQINRVDSEYAHNAMPTRKTVSLATASIANGASATIEITGEKSYLLYSIETSAAAWVRVYDTAANRTADAGRTQGTDPSPNDGVIAEVISTGAQTITFTPGVFGMNNESTPTRSIPISVTNNSGGTAAITVTLKILKLES